jgi:hypothetical protein
MGVELGLVNSLQEEIRIILTSRLSTIGVFILIFPSLD